MRDNHLHTHFSYDCETDFRDYLDHYDGEIVTTEHFDLSNPYGGGCSDDVPDYEQYCAEIVELKDIYGDRIKKGIEIGYYAPREADILDYLADKDYDLKLLSVHHNGQFDYLEAPVFSLDPVKHIPDYLGQMIEAIEAIPADVLAHFDYGFSKLDLSVADLQAHEPLLRQLFQTMMEHNIAFELNSKSMYLYDNEHLYRYALEVLQDMGCRRYSIGSDAHCLEHFRLQFDQLKTLLEEFGIKEERLL